MAFQVGDFVKIKNGVKDADENKYDLSGWKGHIIEIQEKDSPDDETIYEIHWDSDTLRDIPNEFIQTAFDDELSWATYCAGENDLLPAVATEELLISQEFADKMEDSFLTDDEGIDD